MHVDYFGDKYMVLRDFLEWALDKNVSRLQILWGFKFVIIEMNET